MFIGSHKHKLDSKGRFTLASGFRKVLDQKYPDEGLVYFGCDGCLSLFPQSEWEKIQKKIDRGNPLSSEHRRRKRALYSRTAEAEKDNQGRMFVPPTLREYAGLAREILIMGVADHLEIWDLQKWDQLMEEDANNLEAFGDEIARESELKEPQGEH